MKNLLLDFKDFYLGMEGLEKFNWWVLKPICLLMSVLIICYM
jgi:hypothetical protein